VPSASVLCDEFIMGLIRSSVVPLVICSSLLVSASNSIDRHAVVSRYNPHRNASSQTTPIQVGNGNFAFGADVTGLQTFLPYATMSSWGWKNDSLPAGKTQADIINYKGAQWDSHGRPIQYMFDGEPVMMQWMISNPNRVNLGQVGLLFADGKGNAVNVAETDLADVKQDLDCADIFRAGQRCHWRYGDLSFDPVWSTGNLRGLPLERRLV